MSITKKDGYSYGENHQDLIEELKQFSAKSYPIDHSANSVCSCGNDTFSVDLNEEQGVAIRKCIECGAEHVMGDSKKYLHEAEEIYEMECLCGNQSFKVTSGVSLYEKTEDVRWFYIGLLCTECQCMGCYADWKNEFIGYKKLLDNV